MITALRGWARMALCLCTGIVLLSCGMGPAGAAPGADNDTACRLIVPSRNGWAIDMCSSDPSVPATMAVFVDGVSEGLAARVQVYHTSAATKTQPQVAVIYG